MKSPPMESASEDPTGAETDIREWALLVGSVAKDPTGAETDIREGALLVGSAAKPRDPHLTRQIVLDVIALVAAATVVFTAVFANLNALTAATKTATTSAPAKPAAGGTNSLPTKQGGYTKHL